MYIYPMDRWENHQQDEEAANKQGNQPKSQAISKT